MAVPRVYVRRGKTVLIGTSYVLTNTGRTNIDFFIPLHNRPQRGNYVDKNNYYYCPGFTEPYVLTKMQPSF